MLKAIFPPRLRATSCANDGYAFAMIFRRLARPITVVLALWCLWQIYSSHFRILSLAIDYQYLVTNTTKISPAKPRSRIAKVSLAANTLNTSLIHKALQTHKVQNDIHGYTHYIATSDLVDDISEIDFKHRPRGAWSKPAYLLSIIVAELTKPEDGRLEWIFWFDADTVVMNPLTPLEIFLPPSNSMPEVHNIHLLMASNWDGLNSGVFALRVNPWSVSLLSAVLAYPVYNLHKLETDRFRDQSAFQWLLQRGDSPLATTSRGFKGRNHWDHWVEVPMRWFNSLPFNNAFSKEGDWIFNHNMTDATFDNGTNIVYEDGKGPQVRPWKVMQGDMVVHFAGANTVRNSWMGPWIERAEARLPEWSNGTKHLELQAEAWDFWNMTASRMVYEREHLPVRLSETEPYGRKGTQGDDAPLNTKLQYTHVNVAKVAPPSVQETPSEKVLRQSKASEMKRVNRCTIQT